MRATAVAAAVVGLATLPFCSKVARAQEAPAQAPPHVVADTTWHATGPSWDLVGSGVGVFALSYVPSLVVAGSSPLKADQDLYVPLVGPWIDLGSRPGCTLAQSCTSETTARVLLATDGVVQAVGAITILGGLLDIAHESRTVRMADHPRLQIAPARVAGAAYGLTAFGEF